MNSSSIASPALSSELSGESQLWTQHAEATDQAAFYHTWLSLQCSMIEGAVQGVLVLGPPEAGPFVPVSIWPSGKPPGQLLADVAGRTLEARQAQIVEADPSALVSCPLVMDGALHGLVAIETTSLPQPRLRELVRHLRWGLYAIEAALRNEQSLQEQSTRERLIATLDLVASVLAEETFEA